MAQENDPHLMTVEEFNRRVDAWGKKVKQLSGGRLSAMTKVYSGKLRGGLKDRMAKGKDDGVAEWVGFRFERYGVFVAYGVGRGWVRQGGTVVRAQRIRKGDALWHQHRNKGASNKEIARMAIPLDKGGKGRVPKDWLDGVINAHIEGLADIAGEFYGDASMKHILEEFDRMKIVK
jgi:hypothetical protein